MYKHFFKRFIDLIFSIILLPFLLILILVVALAIKAEDKGPIFYTANRLGKNEKIYKMYKFRTMKVNAPDLRNPDGSTFNSEEDPRLLKTGKIFRKTSIDEIPQILNVLFGNMSIIGPRPDLPEHIKQYSKEEKEKLTVLPGLTGYNQAYFRNSIEWSERKKNDVYYARNISFLFDCRIFLKTIQTVLFRKNVFLTKEGS
ncbi:UDP-phosphate galactose phosphotransferase [Planococcus maritimus]|uniref:sugar transferase n=1 Tax=Planococcus maritimus TaxID=192421 RepID=UPI00084C744A|nr:sugar transferase [Planococcus maritimus]OED33962.1 UDP-phosphate galactose phosphotransferase [Planococcus maritimus]